jgi:hypothetical protein
VIQIAAYDDTACAVVASKTVTCWGDRFAVTRKLSVRHAVEVAVGLDICVRDADGRVICVAGDHQDTPVASPSVTDAIRIAAANRHYCVLRASGHVMCSAEGAPWAEVAALDDAISLSLMEGFACAKRKTGEAACWDGEKRIAMTKRAERPLKEIALVVGRVYALDADGNVVWWLEPEMDSDRYPMAPERWSTVHDVRAIVADGERVCALSRAGVVSCEEWVNNCWPSKLRSIQPTETRTTLDDAVALHGAGALTCATRRDGSLGCFGVWNRRSATCENTPRRIPGLGAIDQLVSTERHRCALRAGEVWCWSVSGDPERIRLAE